MGRGAFWLGNDYGKKTDSGQFLWGDFSDWLTIDASIKPPVPRLFLYPKKDAVIPEAMVELFIKCVEKLHPEATVLVEKCKGGSHMTLWQTERGTCVRAVTSLLKR